MPNHCLSIANKSFLVISMLLPYALCQAAVVASYQFEEGTADTPASGDNSILDSSGNGLHGSPLGAPVYRNVGGSLGLEFNGDGVIVPDNPLFELTESLSISATIRLDDYTGLNSQIVWRGDTESGPTDPYRLFVMSGGNLRFSIQTESRTDVRLTSPERIPIGQLLTVAGSLNHETDEMLLFINGTVVASTLTAERARGALDPALDPQLSIGNNPTDRFFPGFIDNVVIRDTALAIPEPSSTALLGICSIGMVLFRRRRARQ